MTVRSAGRRDQRVRTVRLTAAGRAERGLLDRLSDELAGFPARTAGADAAHSPRRRDDDRRPAPDAHSGRIAVEDPRREATLPGAWTPTSPSSTTASTAGFDPARSISADAVELTLPARAAAARPAARRAGRLRALKLHGSEPAEIKRMWVRPTARGLGVGRRLLTALESEAADARGLGRTPRDEPDAHRSHRPLSRCRLRGGRGVQHRVVRRPLVRQAARRERCQQVEPSVDEVAGPGLGQVPHRHPARTGNELVLAAGRLVPVRELVVEAVGLAYAARRRPPPVR